MTPDQFDNIIDKAIAAAPNWFSPRDAVATDAQINSVEEALGSTLPVELTHFWARYGSGYFGQINVCSARTDSQFYWMDSPLRDTQFFVVTDDQTGAYYGFRMAEGLLDEEIYFMDEDGSTKRVASSFFDFVVSVALPEVCRR